MTDLEIFIKNENSYWLGWIKSRCINQTYNTKTRNQIIISLCITGEMSQPIIGKIFDITSGRVASIYRRYKLKKGL